MNRENPDVIVVGAGPSGCAAAITLARKTLKVLLVDRHQFPREKICGDCITPKGLYYLEKIGVLREVLNEALILKGVKIISSGIPENTTEFKDLDYAHKFAAVIPRKKLDYILAKQAEANGVTIWQNTKAVGVEIDSMNYSLILKNPANCIKLSAPAVIFATGCSTGPLGKFLKVNAKDYRAIGVAIRCYASTESNLARYMHIVADETLWPAMGWVFPVNNGTVNVGLGFYVNEKQKVGRSLSDAFEFFLNESIAAKRISRITRILDKPKSLKLFMGGMKNFHQINSFILCGEAAGLVNPFTGEGIGLALKSGIIAGETVAEYLIAQTFDRQKMCREYYERLSAEFDSYLKSATLLRKVASSKMVTKNVIRLLNLFPFLSRFNIKFWTHY